LRWKLVALMGRNSTLGPSGIACGDLLIKHSGASCSAPALPSTAHLCRTQRAQEEGGHEGRQRQELAWATLAPLYCSPYGVGQQHTGCTCTPSACNFERGTVKSTVVGCQAVGEQVFVGMNSFLGGSTATTGPGIIPEAHPNPSLQASTYPQWVTT
jgi:hypothetical protein